MSEKPLIQQFQDDIHVVIDKYRDSGLTLGETVGALELTKLALWHSVDHDEDDEDDRW